MPWMSSTKPLPSLSRPSAFSAALVHTWSPKTAVSTPESQMPTTTGARPLPASRVTSRAGQMSALTVWLRSMASP